MANAPRLGDCPERVAFDLAMQIHADTAKPGEAVARKDEKYWLRLYQRAWWVVQGRELKDVPREG